MTAPSTPLRVALLGYGFGGRVFHAPLIANDPGLELAAIVTTAPLRREQAAAAHPQARLLQNAAQVWARADDFDLVVVATPNASHLDLASAALDQGLAVVVDKPLAPNPADARTLVEKAAANDLLLTVFHNRRWDGDMLTVERLVTSGRLGTVFRFESNFERWRLEVGSGWKESADPIDAGGVLLDLGPHLVDQALHLFGPVRSVWARVRAARPSAQVNDDAYLCLIHTSGTESHLHASLVTAQVGPRMRVLGNRGAYTTWGMDPQERDLIAGRSPDGADWGKVPAERWGTLGTDDNQTRMPTEAGNYPAFYAGVRESLLTGAAPPVDPMDAVSTGLVLEAAHLSSKSESVITL